MRPPRLAASSIGERVAIAVSSRCPKFKCEPDQFCTDSTLECTPRGALQGQSRHGRVFDTARG